MGPGDGGLAGIAREYLREVDAAVVRAGAALSRSGLALTCRPGCSHCCSLPVNATLPEAHLAAGYVRENLPPREAAVLVERSVSWLSWSRDELPRYCRGADLAAVYAMHGPSCPLLSGGLCTVYPVRPMGCRVHCSTSEPALCGPGERDNPLYNPSGMVDVVVAEVRPLCMAYRHRLEGMGIAPERLVRPFPEMLVELLGGEV